MCKSSFDPCLTQDFLLHTHMHTVTRTQMLTSMCASSQHKNNKLVCCMVLLVVLWLRHGLYFCLCVCCSFVAFVVAVSQLFVCLALKFPNGINTPLQLECGNANKRGHHQWRPVAAS